VNVESIVRKFDGYAKHSTRDCAIIPACQDAAGIGSEADDVAEDFERRKGLVNYGDVTLAETFYGYGEAAKTF